MPDFVRRGIEFAIANATASAAAVIIGPRRCGKTTFLRNLVTSYEGEARWLNCDLPGASARLNFDTENDVDAFLRLAPTIIIDEAQRVPNIGLILKMLVDRNELRERPSRIFVTGSSSLDLADSNRERSMPTDGTLIPGKVKQIHITKDCGKWFVTFATEFEIPDPVMKEKDVGIDVGIVHAVTLSNGKTCDLDVKTIKKIEGEIASLKRRLSLNQSSRKKLAAKGLAEEFDKRKPSRTRRRLKELIQKKYKRIRSIRQDFHRKTAHALAQEYGCVYVEDLHLCNMTKSARGTNENPGNHVRQKRALNRALLRMGLRALRTAIEEAMNKMGGMVIAVPAQFTSQRCPNCGCTDNRNRPTQALFSCVDCGYTNNADIVGSINVMTKGRMSPSAHDKKRIARAVSAEGAGDPLSVSAPSAGTTRSTS